MIKKNLKKIILTSVITLLPIIVGLIFWNRLPDKVPTHFNLEGEVDGWSSKVFAVFGLPAFLLVMHIVCTIATAFDPKSKNIEGKPLNLVLWICPMVSAVVAIVTYPTALGYKINVTFIMLVFMSLLFIIIGNYLPKCRPNYTIGIKVPWTLDDEENWNKTHRFAGKLWVVCGIITLVTAFLNIPWVFFALILVITVVPIVYSYVLYKNKKQP